MRMNNKLFMGILVSLVSLSACSTTQATYEGLSASQDGYSLTSTARYMSSCPSFHGNQPISFSGPATINRAFETSPIVTVLAGLAGDFVTELVGRELESATKGRTGQFIALGVFGPTETIFVAGEEKVNGNGCLVVYRGKSGDPRQNTNLSDKGLPLSTLLALGLSDQPAFYLELGVTEYENSRQLNLQYFQYAATSARFQGTGQKTVTVAIGFATQATDPENVQTASEIYRLNLGRLEIGYTYGPELAATAVSPSAANPPFNIIVQVTESDQPNVALEALVAAFDRNKSEISDAISSTGG